ncbi:MAG: hypothetical protein ACYTGQ_16200, partial [Planctomycetota bacterium]
MILSVVPSLPALAAEPTHLKPDPFIRSFDRKPLDPSSNPYWAAHVNRDRLYDFYAKQAVYFSAIEPDKRPAILPQFPGLDGDGAYSHWGNQHDEDPWRDGRANDVDHGSMVAGPLQTSSQTFPRATCVRFNDDLNAVFNPYTLRFALAWRGRLVRWTDTRRGLLNPIYPGSDPNVPVVHATPPMLNARYLGLYRNGKRVVFAYRHNGQTYYRSAYAKDGKVVEYSLDQKDATQPGPPQWPQRVVTRGQLGQPHQPYTIDTLTLPYKNPFNT